MRNRLGSGDQCVRFAAHMTGSDIGSLQVLKLQRNGQPEVVFERASETGNGDWFVVNLNATMDANDMGVSAQPYFMLSWNFPCDNLGYFSRF